MRIKAKLYIVIFLLLFIIGCQKNSPEYSVAEIINAGTVLLKSTVIVNGVVTISPIIKCTQQFCTEEDLCCQTCSGSPVIGTEDYFILLKGEGFKCSGNNCEMSCTPLMKGSTYQVKGIFLREGSLYSIDVKEYHLIENDE